MEALIILFVSALLLILFLFFPFSFQFKLKYENGFHSEFKISGIKLPIKEKKQNNAKTDLVKTVKILFSEKSKIWKLIKYVLKKSKVKKFSLNITVASEDAAQTAITYGSICSFLYPTVAYLQSNININTDDISVLCDYNSFSSKLNFEIKTKINCLYLITAFLKFYPIIKDLKEGSKQNG
ncbi:MAG: DUF2953 domain-containing protein [Acutalibacteraceae bacterium]|nr:DUF2953 domain-containing protein [Acutalibacteraceae bacterium]